MSIIDKFNTRAEKANSLVCVGLDSEYEKLGGLSQFEFNKKIIEATHEHVASYKANIAFYEARGDAGLRELKQTMDYLRAQHPDIFTICDAKRGDIGNSNRGYIMELFDWMQFDAITILPYLGKESAMPFLERADKCCIIICRTSNPGAGEFQDLGVGHLSKPLWQIIAEHVRDDWNFNNNCMLSAGATFPREMKKMREIAPNMTFLVPGIGAQGGSAKDTVEAGINREGKGLVIHSAQGIIFSDDPKRETIVLKEAVNFHR